MRISSPLALAACIAVLAPAAASADSVATTGPVQSLTSSSAVLTGTADPSSSDSVYFFQYGTTAGYGTATGATPIGTGSRAVSAEISGLAPGTTYHYRLVVGQGSYATTYAYGSDATFTTPVNGSTIATTGQATSVTSTSARLNGVAAPSDPDSSWTFQWGTSTAYGNLTPEQPIGSGLSATSALITALKPNTTYHFRLVVLQSAYSPAYGVGADATLRTLPLASGALKLRSRWLSVRHRVASIKLGCSGAAGAVCTGKVRLSVTVRHGTRRKTVGCGRGRFDFAAPGRKIVKAQLGRGCGALLAAAAKQRLKASLRVSGGATPLKLGVTLLEQRGRHR